VDLIARLNVENPNPFDIPFPEIDWELFINDASFISGLLKDGASLKGRNTVAIDVPLSLTYTGLYDSFTSLLNTREAAYNIALGVRIPYPILDQKTYNLDFSGIIPMLQIPKVSFSGISVKNLGLSRFDFVANFEVENNNNFAMNISEFVYDFTVNNASWAQGSIANAPQLRSNAKTAIPLELSVSSLPLITQITDIVARGSNVNYQSHGNLRLGSDFPGLDRLDLPFNLSGATRLAR
jgi:LEA14-like dessication related protein